MARCTRTSNLEVHHINRYGDNTINNARILCQKCHENTHSYGTHGTSPPEFSQETKDKVLKIAFYQCECISMSGCH
jgi:5-methylcytosine-specific restriction endonuclease McrA